MITSEDTRFMDIALAEARQAYSEGEVPIGAVIVCNGQVIAKGHNQVESLTDITAHAEMLTITSASNFLNAKILSRCTIYVTIEPCAMCATAIGNAQIGRLVYGASEEKYGYRRWAPEVLHKSCKVVQGIRADEAKQLMVSFFKERRK
ncbi:nucleoside deaminase [Falsiporphyromonas endometrii]|uniref:tRNA-specific adenosine deaminase n=1 Tax=Falsiporphyromonas endometrii TaxID=1387297 RepID=A0ABV9KA85_9PORP